MNAKVSKNKLPKMYKDAVGEYLLDCQQEIAKRLVLCSILVGLDGFKFTNEDCNKFKRMLEEIIHGYSDEVYRGKMNIGDITDMRLALEQEIISRGIVLEDWAKV